MIIEAKHWREIPPGQWTYRHFKPQELAQKNTGQIKIARALMDNLETLRDMAGPMTILSGYRSAEYNREVGGAAQSKHVLGEAVDIAMTNHDPAEFYDMARQAGFKGIGFYPSQNFMHLDLGPQRWWGNPKPWGIDPQKQIKSIARKSGVGMSAAALFGETAQQVAYQAQAVSDVSEWIRIGAAVVGAVGLALILWSNLSTKEREQR
jgi:zinc D-Ala-D-Ala carboxypeptidase